MRINQAKEEFIKWGSVKYSIYTIRNYRKYLNCFEKFLRNKSVARIKLNDILEFQKFLKDGGRKNSTIFYYTVAVRSMIRLSFLQNKTKFNHELIPYPKYTHRSWQPAGADELKAMLRVLNHDNLFIRLRNELIIKFLFASGVRVSELCDLHLDVINLMKQEAIIETKKTRDKRVIFWDYQTNEIFVRYLDMRLEVAKCDFVFVNKRGERISTRHVERIVKGLREKAGIKERIVPHSFRHGLGMRGVEKNANLRHLQIILGHRNLESSVVYFPQSDQVVRKTYRKIFDRRY